MKKLTILFLCVLASHFIHAQTSDVIRSYIAAYKDIAMDEMLRTGVPASITLAQGIHETSAGQSDLVRKSNNHFGIKCKSDWTGQSVSHDDDARGECFRKYDDPRDSYRDHSDFLKNRPHYAFLFKLDPMDYEAWAFGLKKAGYATNPKYPQILIKLIRDYNLQEYTLLAMEGKRNDNMVFASSTASTEARSEAPVAVSKDYPAGLFRINDTKVMLITRGTSYLKIAEEYDISLSRLFEFNDMNPRDLAEKDHLLYLQRKRKKGNSQFHIIAPGETLHDIAQAEGIRLENLYEYNFLREGMIPVVGEKLYLQEQAPSMPRLLSDKPQPAVQLTSAPVEKKQESTSTASDIFTTHTVQPKETLYSISKAYGVQVDDLMKWNGMQSADLKIGQTLRIQKKAVNAAH